MAIPASVEPDEGTILRLGIARLREVLPVDWRVEPSRQGDLESPAADGGVDAIISVEDPLGSRGRLVIEVRRAFAPRDVDAALDARKQLVRSLDPSSALVVVAPWLSPRTQTLLGDRGIGYVDLTGNALLRMSRPAFFIRSAGAPQNPRARRREGPSLRGAVAGRVVRLLADVRPPYTATAIAGASGASIAQVSRLLAALDREALVERGPRGLVIDVSWGELLRRRAESYRLFRANAARGYISGAGPGAIADRLRIETDQYLAVTGSFAAAQRAPVAAPGQLTLYVEDADRTAENLELLPTERGADVVLLQPYDSGVVDRPETIDGLKVVAASQLTLDCLSGNGRMPSEGEALLTWMVEHESEWRIRDIGSLPTRRNR
jgi:hypothetical protein